MPLATQMSAVIKRAFVAYWRTPQYILGKFILHIVSHSISWRLLSARASRDEPSPPVCSANDIKQVTGLFNAFTFYHPGFESIDMQSRLFTIFLTLTISPPLIQQLQPVFLGSRNLFSSRENNSKIYSWFAWTTGAILPELPYSIVAGTIYYACWWWASVGYRMSSFTSGYIYLTLMFFECYYVGFGQARKLASLSPLLRTSDLLKLPLLHPTNSSPLFWFRYSSSSLSASAAFWSHPRVSPISGAAGCTGSHPSITCSKRCLVWSSTTNRSAAPTGKSPASVRHLVRHVRAMLDPISVRLVATSRMEVVGCASTANIRRAMNLVGALVCSIRVDGGIWGSSLHTSGSTSWWSTFVRG
jgi:hypothetical protein